MILLIKMQEELMQTLHHVTLVKLLYQLSKNKPKFNKLPVSAVTVLYNILQKDQQSIITSLLDLSHRMSAMFKKVDITNTKLSA
jgi:hypothetical protein